MSSGNSTHFWQSGQNVLRNRNFHSFHRVENLEKKLKIFETSCQGVIFSAKFKCEVFFDAKLFSTSIQVTRRILWAGGLAYHSQFGSEYIRIYDVYVVKLLWRSVL